MSACPLVVLLNSEPTPTGACGPRLLLGYAARAVARERMPSHSMGVEGDRKENGKPRKG